MPEFYAQVASPSIIHVKCNVKQNDKLVFTEILEIGDRQITIKQLKRKIKSLLNARSDISFSAA